MASKIRHNATICVCLPAAAFVFFSPSPSGSELLETESKEQNCDGGRCEHALHCARGSSKDRLCAPTRPDTSEKRGVVCFRVRRVASAMQKKTEERRLLASLVANPASRAAFCHRPTGRSATAGLPSARLTNRGRACSFGSRARRPRAASRRAQCYTRSG